MGDRLGKHQSRLEDGVLPARPAPAQPAELIRNPDQRRRPGFRRDFLCGVAPGFAGLYQVNVRLPGQLPANPEIRLDEAGH